MCLVHFSEAGRGHASLLEIWKLRCKTRRILGTVIRSQRGEAGEERSRSGEERSRPAEGGSGWVLGAEAIDHLQRYTLGSRCHCKDKQGPQPVMTMDCDCSESKAKTKYRDIEIFCDILGGHDRIRSSQPGWMVQQEQNLSGSTQVGRELRHLSVAQAFGVIIP